MWTVILVSNQPVLLCGLAHILQIGSFDVAACCAAEDLFGHVSPASRIDVAVIDVTDGLTLANLAQFHARIPDCPVVLWTDALPLDLIFRTLEFGVRGVVRRTAQPQQLCDSLCRVAGGEMQIGFALEKELPAQRSYPALTPREREVISKLRQGLRNKQIAAEMSITEGTVKIYLFRLFQKMGVRNRFELAQCGIPGEMQFQDADPSRTSDRP